MDRRDFLKYSAAVAGATLVPSFGYSEPKKIRWNQVNLCQSDFTKYLRPNYNVRLPLVTISDGDNSSYVLSLSENLDINESKRHMEAAGGPDSYYYQINCGNHRGLVFGDTPLYRNNIELSNYSYCPQKYWGGGDKYSFRFEKSYSFATKKPASVLPGDIFDKLSNYYNEVSPRLVSQIDFFSYSYSYSYIADEKCYRTEADAMRALIQAKLQVATHDEAAT